MTINQFVANVRDGVRYPGFVVIVGPQGSGKNTAVALLTRVFNVACLLPRKHVEPFSDLRQAMTENGLIVLDEWEPKHILPETLKDLTTAKTIRVERKAHDPVELPVKANLIVLAHSFDYDQSVVRVSPLQFINAVIAAL